MKKGFLTALSLICLSGFAYANTYAPPEGAGLDMYGYMYQDYKKDPAYQEERDVMPIPSFLKRKDPEAESRREPHEIKTNSTGAKKNVSTPMQYHEFPQNIDSSQQMFMMQNGMMNMMAPQY